MCFPSSRFLSCRAVGASDNATWCRPLVGQDVLLGACVRLGFPLSRSSLIRRCPVLTETSPVLASSEVARKPSRSMIDGARANTASCPEPVVVFGRCGRNRRSGGVRVSRPRGIADGRTPLSLVGRFAEGPRSPFPSPLACWVVRASDNATVSRHHVVTVSPSSPVGTYRVVSLALVLNFLLSSSDLTQR